MFERRFANLAVDILALDCDEQVTFFNRSKHAQVVASFASENMTPEVLDLSISEKFGNFGVSVAPDERILLATPHLGEISPEFTCAFKEDQKDPDLRVSLPFDAGLAKWRASFGVCGGVRQGSLFVTRQIRLLDSVRCDLAINWCLHQKPVLSSVFKAPYVNAFLKLGFAKQVAKAQATYGPWYVFAAFGRENDSAFKEKCGVIARYKRSSLGLRCDFLKQTLKVKSELVGAWWSLAHMLRFDRNGGMRAQAGGEYLVSGLRTRCMLDSQGVGVLEGRFAMTKKASAKASVKYDRESEKKFCWGLQLKFDHQ